MTAVALEVAEFAAIDVILGLVVAVAMGGCRLPLHAWRVRCLCHCALVVAVAVAVAVDEVAIEHLVVIATLVVAIVCLV